MRKSEIRKAVFRIIEKYAEEKLKDETALRDEAGIDSLDMVQICMDMESEFNIHIDDDELFSPEVEKATAGEIVDRVMEKLKELDSKSEDIFDEEREDNAADTSEKDSEQQPVVENQRLESIAEEYLISKAKVWCKDRNRWETCSLSMLPDGNFVDEHWRLHRKEYHIPYVTLDDAMEAVRITLAKLLENKEWDFEKLKQDAFLTKKLQELSKTQEQIGRDSVYDMIFRS